jgi:hypothetical protein
MFNCLKIDSLSIDSNGNYTAHVVSSNKPHIVFIAKELMFKTSGDIVLWVSVKRNYDYLNEKDNIWNSIATNVFTEINVETHFAKNGIPIAMLDELIM